MQLHLRPPAVPRIELGTYRSLSVWYRHWMLFTHHWKTESWPPFVEAFVAIAALGLGLGQLIPEVDGVPYLVFVAPAIAALFPAFVATFEGLWSAWFRMENNKTYDAMLATPISVSDIVSGEIIWGASRALFSGAALLVMCFAFGAIQSWTALLFLPVIFLSGLMWTGIGLTFTSISPSIYFLGVFFTLVINPQFWISGAFTPISTLPGWLQIFAVLAPLTHVVNIARATFSGSFDLSVLVSLMIMVVITVGFYLVVLVTMRNRLVT